VSKDFRQMLTSLQPGSPPADYEKRASIISSSSDISLAAPLQPRQARSLTTSVSSLPRGRSSSSQTPLLRVVLVCPLPARLSALQSSTRHMISPNVRLNPAFEGSGTGHSTSRVPHLLPTIIALLSGDREEGERGMSMGRKRKVSKKDET
jgi:hypothetical protein